jgi:hypothetical protein
MKRFHWIFIYLISAFNLAYAVSFESICKNTKQEHHLAIDVSRQFQIGKISKEEAEKILISAFSDYSHPDGKLATMAQFVQTTTGLEYPILTTSSEQRGWSGNEVYAIQAETNGEILFFLKIFPYDAKYYLPEIFGLSLMKQVKEVDSPTLYACGQCLIDDIRYFLVIETPVKGLSIQQYFIRVGQCQKDSTARKQALKELCEATQACGKGLAKFHKAFPSKKQAFPQEAEQALRQDLKSALEELAYQPIEGIETKKLQAYTENLVQKMKAQDHLRGLAYDDVKTIHTFYDHQTHTFSLVNPARLNLSFDVKGELQGLLTKDICKYFLSLKLNRYQYYLNENQSVSRKELLTEEEVNVVTDCFELGYAQEGGTLPTSIEKEYFFLQQDLFFIKNMRRTFPEPELTRVRDLIEISLENIKCKLAD